MKKSTAETAKGWMNLVLKRIFMRVSILLIIILGIFAGASCKKNEEYQGLRSPNPELQLEFSQNGALIFNSVETLLERGREDSDSQSKDDWSITELPSEEEGCRRFRVQYISKSEVYEPVEVIWRDGMTSLVIMSGNQWICRLTQNLPEVER